MIYSAELQSVISRLHIKEEERLFLTIKNIYLDEMREQMKNVEYRSDTEFFRRKLFVKGDNGKPSTQMKPLKYILFQGGYEPDSPRLLIELKGWTIDGKKFPADLLTTGHDVEPYDICLLLGNIVFDSQDGRLFRDLPAKKKKIAAASSGEKTKKIFKPRKKKLTVADKMSNRRSSMTSIRKPKK